GPEVGRFGEKKTSPAIGIPQDSGAGTETVHGRPAHIEDDQVIRAELHAEGLERPLSGEEDGYLRHERWRLRRRENYRYRTSWFHGSGVGSLGRISPKRIFMEGNVTVQHLLNGSGLASWKKRRHGSAWMYPGGIL